MARQKLRLWNFLEHEFVTVLLCRMMPEKACAEQLHSFLAQMNGSLICTNHSGSLVCGV